MTTIATYPAPKTDAQCEQLWSALLEAAAQASTEWLNPDSDINRYPGGLGSAWVKIPNRGAFAKWLARTSNGSTYGSSGITIRTWVQNGFPQTGQSESYSVHIVRAVSRTLAEYGIKSELGSYSS
jgi:hypothetical protein